MMFKSLFLQSWYKLSDPAIDKQLARDLLFRRFVELDITESVPDHCIFWLFRQKLNEESLMNNLLFEINAKLCEQVLFIESGGVSIIDAFVIEANQCCLNKDNDEESTQDPEEKWNVKAGSDG